MSRIKPRWRHKPSKTTLAPKKTTTAPKISPTTPVVKPPAPSAYLDTTIVVDYLLKSVDQNKAVKSCLKPYVKVALSQYAIKELCAGALSYFVWLYNVVVTEPSLVEILLRIQSVRGQPNRLSTALSALAVSTQGISSTIGQWEQQYGRTASPQAAQKDEIRLQLKQTIFSAWSRRHEMATETTHQLDCFTEGGIATDAIGQLRIESRCRPNDCCLRDRLLRDRLALKALVDALPIASGKRETERRRAVLRKIEKHPAGIIGTNDCRALGDAVHAFQCPSDYTLLTTNISDHLPLMAALGKQVVKPY